MKIEHLVVGGLAAYLLFKGGEKAVEIKRTSDYGPMVDDMADRVGVSRAVVRALVKQESNWNPSAVNSSTGDYGLFQLNLVTARKLDPTQIGQMPGILLLPEVNVSLAEKLLREIVRAVGDDPETIFHSWNVGWPSFKRGVRSPYIAGYLTAYNSYRNQEGIA